jgi:hypothetical protein
MLAAALPGTGTLLTIGALLATFVAGLFARSVLEHEIGLYRHAQLKRGYREHAAAHPYQRPTPALNESNWHDPEQAATIPFRLEPETVVYDREADAELHATMVAWPTRLG